MKLLDYIKGDRRGKEAHGIELDAMDDPFLSEAVEGFDSVERNHEEALQRLQARISSRSNPRQRRKVIAWSTAAAVLLCLSIGGLMYMRATVDGTVPLAVLEEEAGKTDADSLSLMAVVPQQQEQNQAEIQGPERLQRETEIIAEQQKSRIAINEFSDALPPSIINDSRAETSFDFAAERMEDAAIAPSEVLQDETAAEEIAVPFAAPSPSVLSAAASTAPSATAKQERPGEIQQTEVQQTQDIQASVSGTMAKKNETASRSVVNMAADNFQESAGNKRFDDYVAKNIIPQKDAQGNPVNGSVIAEFNVNPSGRPINVRVVQSLSPEADREARRLLLRGPDWPTSNSKITVSIEFK